MQTLNRKDIPEDFSYYRTGSKVFFDYYQNHKRLILHRLGSGYAFLRAARIIGNIYSVIVEKADREPTREYLRTLGMHHGIVFW